MQFLTLAAALFSAAAVAAPTSDSQPLERRGCQVAYPSSIGFPINFDIKQDAGGANARENFVKWTGIPKGSYGCQMEVNFPAGYPVTNEGSSKVNIFSMKDGKEAGLFGTVTFASSPVAATKYVINSAQCDTLMSYKMKIASADQAGRAAFADTKSAGLSMTYNC
ncbi:hypothetical protein EJ04DRAFT_558342 [Polyplosphaeria fusca]|uniref:Ubiquitin 3 binding protein But2 C-terminal domain-containing protein n=1 Tax=Polyplosphaeria fusca TaxID=682080 RepID=A0A9P4R8I2_9PLEO|nr:hypothetical protein EJ04DRAFT_558342 [Polyplosphaeria fusca]